jgi:hypothetical protein
MTTAGAVPTTRCRVCETEVPAGAFCGACGAQLSAERGDGRGRLRLRAYAAAPAEHVLRVSVASSIFPHLPHRSRTPFRVGWAILLVILIAFALLRWQAPLIAASSLGLTTLFVLYLYEADVFADLPRRLLLVTAALGIGLGVGWALMTGPFVAGSFDVALSGPVATGPTILADLAVPLGGALLMLVPAAVARALQPPTQESLDGFVMGSWGAIVFTAAATLALLAPQLATGPITPDQPLTSLLAQAGIRGVAMPLIAAAAGGLFGVALWFTRPRDGAQRWPAARLPLALAVVLAVYAALSLTQVAPFPDEVQLGLHLAVMGLAVVALRFGLHAALLYESHGDPSPGEPLLCPHCEHVIPDMPFCPNCGVASRASSRSSRSARRRARPEAGGADAEGVAPPGYALPAATYAVEPMRHTSHRRLLLTFGAGVAVAAAAAVAISVLVTPVAPRYVCPPDCGRPPIGQRVEINPRFTAGNGDFSVTYPGTSKAYRAKLAPNGVVLDFVAGDTGTLELFGEPASDRTPRQVADELIKSRYPDASTAYEIPNAMVGYQLGYGVVADDYPQDASGRYTQLRILVMVAVKNGLALIASAVGRYHEFSPDFGTGHPSGANLQLAMDMAKYVNSFSWRGDPER